MVLAGPWANLTHCRHEAGSDLLREGGSLLLRKVRLRLELHSVSPLLGGGWRLRAS